MQALHEIRALRQGRTLHTEQPYLADLDLNDVPVLRDTLTRHVFAIAARAGARREETHLFSLEVYATNDGRGYGQPLYRWALPVELLP